MLGAGLPAGGRPRVAETMLETIRVSQTINFRNGFESRMGFRAAEVAPSVAKPRTAKATTLARATLLLPERRAARA